MFDDTAEPFLFPAVGRKKVIANFDGGRITSDGDVILLAAAEPGFTHEIAQIAQPSLAHLP